MTTIAEVMEEADRRLATIEGLRTYAYPPTSVSPPAAWVRVPDIDYDLTFRRPGGKLMLPVVVVVSKVTDRAARTQLANYLDPSLDRSIPEALDGAFNGGYFRVRRVTPDWMSLGGSDYWSAAFEVEVVI